MNILVGVKSWKAKLIPILYLVSTWSAKCRAFQGDFLKNFTGACRIIMDSIECIINTTGRSRNCSTTIEGEAWRTIDVGAHQPR